MKKVIFSLFSIIGCSGLLSAQTLASAKIEAMKVKIVTFFNAKDATGLYSLAGEDFRKALSAEQFEDISNNQLFPLAPIKEAVFEKMRSDVAIYKIVFEAGDFQLLFSQDAAEKLKVFLIRPYKKEAVGPITKTNTDNALKSPIDILVDSVMQKAMFHSKAVGTSVAVLKEGKTYFYNYGEMKRGSKNLPTKTSLYEIGSITKTFTGTLLAKAVFEGKLRLEDPISKYLPKDVPELKRDGEPVRLVHLANHTSGLPQLPDDLIKNDDITNPYATYTKEQLFNFLKRAKVSTTPGSKHAYNNLAVSLIGIILEDIYKTSFENMVQKFVATPAQMENTKQHLLPTDGVLKMQGYDASGKENSQWDFMAFTAAGSLRSSTKDLIEYAKYNLIPSALSEKEKKILALAQTTTYNSEGVELGLNWFKQNWGRGEVLMHGGATNTFVSILGINKKSGTAIVILANTVSSFDDAAVEILNQLSK